MFLEGLRTVVRRWARKCSAIVLAAIFLVVGIYLLVGPVISAVTTRSGQEARIVSVSNNAPVVKTGGDWGGWFEVTVRKNGKNFDGIRCPYPAWAIHFKPSAGDFIRVWPPAHPFVGGVPVSGLGWFLLTAVFILGLLFLEFAFLCLTVA